MSIWDALERAAYTGLGLAALTKDKLDEAVETLKKERGLTDDEGRRLAEELKDGAETARRNLDDRVDAAVERAYRRLNLATRADIETLQARIEELEGQLKKKEDSGD
jgi:polyhydroxyalkanoate synthesis regulator phasin